MNIIHYADSTNIAKQYKSASNTSVVLFLLWGVLMVSCIKRKKKIQKCQKQKCLFIKIKKKNLANVL
jgi:hypothetical protein